MRGGEGGGRLEGIVVMTFMLHIPTFDKNILRIVLTIPEDDI